MMHSCKGPVLSEKKGDLAHKNGGIMRFYGISKQAVVGWDVHKLAILEGR